MIQNMRELIDKLNYYNKMYDEGHPVITDEEYDELYFQLERLESNGIIYPDSPTQHIDYQVVNELKKVQHNHPMLSLAKTKDWQEFINYFGDKDVIGMLKMDGLTCSLTYQNGQLVAAETRGNGEVGEDILHNAKVISSIPKEITYKDELIVDGEIICKLDDFEEFSDEYANARNFASGSIRLLDAAECARRHLTFVVWNIIKGWDTENSFLNKLNNTEKLGFIIVPYTSSWDLDAKEFLVNKAKELKYPIDGLVGRFDDIKYGESLGLTGHHSKAAYAFKFYDETYETYLRGIEWTIGKTAALTPVAIYDTVDTGDSIIEKASLHNLNIMKQILGKPYFGQKIEIAKMNMIIPQVMNSISAEAETQFVHPYTAESLKEPYYFEVPTVCPYCGSNTYEKDDFLYCSNPQCSGKLINQLDHFAGKKGLDIKGLSQATLEKLITWGWVENIVDLFTLAQHRDEWIEQPGFGAKSVDKILTNIEESKKCELWQFISALSIPNIGSTYAKQIASHFKSWGDFMWAVETKFDFTSWDGFGYEMNDSLLKFDYDDACFIHSHYNLQFSNSLYKNPEEEIEVTSKIAGMSICITGKLMIYKNRDELVAAIEKAGGKFVSSVSSKTNYLVNNDISSTSSKNIKAKQLGIPIITEAELIAMF